MDWFERFFRRTKTTVILMGVALLVLGIALFVSPIGATLLVVRVMGWVLLAVGALTLAGCWRHYSEGLRQADLFMGLLECVPGACLVIWPDAFVSVVYALIGVVILMTGFNDVIEANALRHVVGVGWGWRMALGVATVVVGLVVVASPFTMAELVMLVAGVALVFDGITEIVAGISMP